MEFVAKGMGTLIQKLQFELFSAQKQNGDESYFLWVIKRFVKLAVLEQVSFESVKTVLAVPTFSLVTFLAVASCEQLMLLQRKNADASPHEKILKLAVAALHDMLWTVEYFMTEKKRALKQQDKEYLLNLHAELSSMEDIRQMFLLLIRLYQPHLQNLDYLKKLIITNHSYILMLQKATPTGNFDMLHHIKQFATEEVMQHYGRLLETFTENVPAVNECIFTMMHHIAGPCEKPESLLQINILKTFSEISHHQYPLNEDASDLVEYILKIFERLAERDPYHCAQQLLKMKEDEPGSPESESDQTESLDSHWSDEDVDILFMTYTEHESDPNLVDKIVEALEDHGISKTRCEVTNQLTHLGLLADQSMNLIDVIGGGSSVETTDSEISTDDASLVQDTAAILNRCVKKLEGKGHQVHLAWLQRVLLEVCYIKLGGKKIYGKVEEPILYFYVAQDKSVPVIPFSGAQEAILQDKAFRCLLLSLGIYLPEEGWQLYPRIPHFWNAENLFSKAKSLGTIPKGILKFHPDDIQSGKSDQLSSVESEPSMSTSLQGYKLTDGSTKRSQSNSNISSALWMAFVQQCNLERSKIGMGGISRKMEQNSTSSDSSLNMRVGQVD
ncbi:protein timeless [Lingula anatina]|uniref:Protein timeless n=1 Tax=Lingula anatina TaxID=7574 RepID=A0A1S3IFF9_LINAN|nr:protein timeless [Lingula anatina]|eukprot:XP_013396878.1 protein timeless [Lingula anatina]